MAAGLFFCLDRSSAAQAVTLKSLSGDAAPAGVERREAHETEQGNFRPKLFRTARASGSMLSRPVAASPFTAIVKRMLGPAVWRCVGE
jgi:hypothetical protein